MNIVERTAKIKSTFSLDRYAEIEDSSVEMIPFSFRQEMGKEDMASLQNNIPITAFCSETDNSILENQYFQYIVFNPKGMSNSSNAILLMHGLNERTWDKYLTWAEYLTEKCGRPVILFPIAFHINRTPSLWSAPRWIMPWAAKRKEEIAGLANCSFFNAALSSRLSMSPSRFYISGRESIYNIWQLMMEIRDGKHPIFSKDCSLDIFAYSIGALLSQVLLMSNPGELFTDAKLFTFCGGSIFECMNGNAKDIMDQEAFEKIHNYYLGQFLNSSFSDDAVEKAFKAMISVDYMKNERESFFSKAKNRIKMILLNKDSVVPVDGARKAVGEVNSSGMVEEMDFPYQYNHQAPFPLSFSSHANADVATICFRSVFDKAAAFLCGNGV
jgi:hypothetical protein